MKRTLLVLTAVLLVTLGLLIASCGEAQMPVGIDEATKQVTSSSTSTPTPTSAPSSTLPTPICQETFEERELREPYQRHKAHTARYTLSDEGLHAYLDLMGIDSLCLPQQFGAPFVNADWNSLELPPATGRMVSIGFEALYDGGGWSRGYLVYATYDFSFGSEYEVFATPADLENVRTGSVPNLIDAGGVTGFVRFHPHLAMGKQIISKTYIFPFEDDYVVAVIELGAYDPATVDDVLIEMEAGRHPDLLTEEVALMDFLVASLEFGD